MKIDKLKINSYGKLKNKEINLTDGINIIYGENEKGKSTVLNFIVNMFYGTSKNKRGKEISDFDKYKPWDTEEFSGKIYYTLDNDEKYEVFREFGKKNPKIYNENKEDISKDYAIDKSMGNQFFLEQTKVDELTFTGTVVSFQNDIEIDNQTQNVLLQKIANTSSTGEDNVSFKKAIDKLSKKQLEEVGTSRSQGKPINIVVNEIENINSVNESLKKYENYKYEIEEKEYRLEEELRNLNINLEIIKKIKYINEERAREEEKIKYSENKIDELEKKIQSLLDEKEKVNRNVKNIQKANTKKTNKLPYIISAIIFAVIGIVIKILGSILIAVIPILFAIIILIILFIKESKLRKKNIGEEKIYNEVIRSNNEVEKRLYEINAQIDILEKNEKEQVDETEKIRNSVNKKYNEEKERIKFDYYKVINEFEINRMCNTDNIMIELEKTEQNINDKNMDLHRLKLDKENILPKLEMLAENEEKLEYNKEQFQELKEKNNAINLAKEIIEKSYQKMKNDVTPMFTKNLSKNISDITNGKYSKIAINEESGILIELPNGEYKDANRLSVGTIQQLYLSFRLSMIEDISKEKMPIVLDEIFAYYDDSRLIDTINSIKNNYSDKHQIILLTCTNREEEALKKLGIIYNKINL